jgi:protein phosphatase inhibitor 2
MSGVESPRHSPPPSSQAPKPKGILKNPLDRRPSQGEPLTSSPPARGPPQGLSIETQGPNGLSWDEQGIALHDLEKEQTTRMKIDEPKTPFVRGSGTDDDGQFECEW